MIFKLLLNLSIDSILSSSIQCHLWPSLILCSHTQFLAGMEPCPKLLKGNNNILLLSICKEYFSYSCGSITILYGIFISSNALLVNLLSHLPFEIKKIG